jgi:hypothetical protein
VAGHQLIDDHLSRLARRLPADTVDELADGLTETWQHHLAAGLHTDEAARAAIGEFGTPDQITAAFIAQAPGRRTARMLLATGPPIGVCWGASLVTAQVWTWPIPVAAMVTAAVALLVVVVALVLAATGRRSYRRTRLGSVGAIGLLALDAAMLAGAILLAPTLVWPMAVAMPASLARIGLTLRTRGVPRTRWRRRWPWW